MRARVPLIVSLLGACGGGFDVDGAPGTPVAISLDDLTPVVNGSVNGVARPLVCDSGSPVTQIDNTAIPGIPDGKRALDIAAFGLEFPDFPGIAFDVFDGNDTGGVLGYDLLSHFPFTIDYHGSRAWLGKAAPPSDLQLGTARRLPVDILGGGTSSIPNCSACGGVRFPRSRVILQATFEGQSDPVWVMVDTGTSAVLIDDALFAALGGSGRPRLEGAVVGTFDGPTAATVTRLYRVTLRGLDGTTAETTDVAAVVAPGFTRAQLPGLAAEVGRNVKALVGGAFLRAHLTTLDYPDRALELAPYQDLSHIAAGEWIGVGFTWAPGDGGAWKLDQVFTNHDAYAQGVRVGDLLEEVNGMPVRGQPPGVVDGALARYRLGERVPITYNHLGDLLHAQVLVEDLLPHYPPPT